MYIAKDGNTHQFLPDLKGQAMTKNKPRPFEEHDWYGFAGCEAWSESQQPLWYELNDTWLLIADKNGVGAYENNDDAAGYNGWFWDVKFPTQLAAAAYLNGLPEDFDPANYGFKRS